VCGDLNGDGIVNILDGIALINIAVGGAQANPAQDIAGDVDGDGSLTVGDLIPLLKSITGWDGPITLCGPI